MARKTDIRLRRSAVSGAVPGGADLNLGELALNTADGAIFVKNGAGNIVTVSHDGIIHYDEPNSRVGIGTTSPGTKLHINSGTSDVVSIFESTDTYADIRLKDNAGSSYIRNSQGNLFIQADREDAVSNTTIRFSIDNSEKSRIDSNGNFLVGTTTAGNSSAGFRAYAGGNGAFTIAGTTLNLNRLSSDGEILSLQKDTVAAGSIGVNGTYVYIGSHGNSGKGLKITDALLPATNTGGFNDADVNLGASNVRWKDLYLSGGHMNGAANSFTFVSGGNASNAGANILLYGQSHSGSPNTTVFRAAGTESVRIDANGNVGIGTTSPSSKLHVDGHITLTDGDDIKSPDNFAIHDTGGSIDRFAFSTNNFFNVREGGYQRFTTRASGGSLTETLRLQNNRVQINNSSSIDNNAQLHITGYSSGHAGITMQDVDVTNGKTFIKQSSGTTEIQTQSGSSHGIFKITGWNGTAAAEFFRVTGDGYVGIGTTNPGTQLEINSDGSYVNGAELLLKHSNNNSTDIISTIKFANNAGSAAMIQGGTTGANNSGYISFHTDNAGTSAEAVRIDSAGKVGIGETAPDGKLHIKGGTATGDLSHVLFENTQGSKVFAIGGGASGVTNNNLYIRNVTDNTTPMVITDAGAATFTGAVTVDALTVAGSNANLVLGTTGNDITFTRNADNYISSTGGTSSNIVINPQNRFVVNTGSSERLRINSNGNVGIGTTSPSSKLTVAGDIELTTGDLKYTGNINWDIAHHGASQNIVFSTTPSGGSATERMRIRHDGRVGIGTSSPDVYGIHASNSSNSVYFKSVSGSIQTLYGGATALGYGLLGTTTNHPLAIYTNNSEKVRIDSSGNVGIGQITPSTLLHLKKTGSTSAVNEFIRIENSAGGGAAAGSSIHFHHYHAGGGPSGGAKAASITAQNMASWPGGTPSSYSTGLTFGTLHENSFDERMRIDSSGKVGIGTTAPSELLHVKGTNGAIAIDGNGSSNTASIKFINDNERSRITSAYDTGGGGRLTFHTDTTGGSLIERMRIDNAGKITFNGAFTFPTSIGSAGQVLKVPTSGTELIWGNASGGGGGSSISDNDSDTKIQVEESADEDIIRFDIAGSQKMLLDSTQLNLTGDLAVSGNLNIAGDINSTSVTNLDVTDKTITVANNAGSAANANGAGIVVDTGTNNPQMIYTSATDEWDFNRSIDINGGSGTGLKIHQGGAIVGAKSGGDTQLMYWGGGPVYYGRSNLGGSVTGHEFRVSGVTKLNVNSSGNTIISGNTGIGTSSPSNKLHVTSGTVNTAIARFTGANNDRGLVISTSVSGSTNDSIINYDAVSTNSVGQHSFKTDGTERVRINSTGQVLVTPLGVTTPSFAFTNDTNTGMTRPTGDTLQFITAGAERIRIDSSGNVGIGGTPSAKLHIVNNSTSVDALYLESTEDSSSAAPVLAFKRNSSSVADADYLGQLKFKGENDADQEVVYAKITSKILDASDGSEDGLIEFANRKAGSNVITARLRSDSLQLLNDTSLAIKTDGAQLQFGSDNDMQIYHNGANGEINNGTGNFTIDSVGDIILDADGGDVSLLDNGTQYAKFTNFLGGLAITSGGTNALVIGGTDGSMIMGGNVSLGDNKRLELGDSDDLLLYHDGTNSFIRNYTGNLYIDNTLDDKDILLRSDDGSGGVATYFQLDGSQTQLKVHKNMVFFDSVKAQFGDSADLQIFHDGSNSFINNTGGGSGALSIKSHDINLMSSASETMASFVEDAGVNLYFNNSKKLETVTGGVEATGYLSSTAGAYINTNTGSNPLYITRQGNTNESLKIYVGDSAAMFESIQDETEDNYGSFIFAMDDGVTEPYFDIRKGTAASGSKFYVDGSGAVGIGTSTPSGGLHVANNFVRVDNSEGVAARKLRSSYFSNGQDLTLESGSSADIIMTTTNVGISETNPVHKVEAKGTDAALVVHNNGNSRGGIVALASQLVGFTSTSVNDDLVFGHAGNPIASSAFNEKMRIDNGTGNVSIGTSASGARKLDVLDNGDVNGEIIQIKGNANYGAVITYHRGGSYAWEAGIGGGSSQDANIPSSYWGVGERAASGRPARFLIAHTSGNVGIGVTPQTSGNVKLRVGGAVRFEDYTIDNTTTTTTATSAVTIHSFPKADFRTARFTIQITNTTDSTYHSTEIIAVHDGTTANITEFGEVHTGSSVEATFDADIDSGNFRLRATPASTDSMTFKVVCHSITV